MPTFFGARAKDFMRCLKNIHRFADGQASVVEYDGEHLKFMKILLSPKSGPYEGGHFEFLVNFPDDYPKCPPDVICKTNIYHPNINIDIEDEKNVCFSLFDEWSDGKFGMEDVINGLLFLLNYPNISDPWSEFMDSSISDRRLLRNIRRSLAGMTVEYYDEPIDYEFPKFVEYDAEKYDYVLTDDEEEEDEENEDEEKEEEITATNQTEKSTEQAESKSSAANTDGNESNQVAVACSESDNAAEADDKKDTDGDKSPTAEVSSKSIFDKENAYKLLDIDDVLQQINGVIDKMKPDDVRSLASNEDYQGSENELENEEGDETKEINDEELPIGDGEEEKEEKESQQTAVEGNGSHETSMVLDAAAEKSTLARGDTVPIASSDISGPSTSRSVTVNPTRGGSKRCMDLRKLCTVVPQNSLSRVVALSRTETSDMLKFKQESLKLSVKRGHSGDLTDDIPMKQQRSDGQTSVEASESVHE